MLAIVILVVTGDAVLASSFADSEVPPRPLSIYFARPAELSLLFLAELCVVGSGNWETLLSTRLVDTIDVLLLIATVALVNSLEANVKRDTTHKSKNV